MVGPIRSEERRVGKEEYFAYNLETSPPFMTVVDGKIHGGIRGHILLTHRGSSTMLGQALH